MGQEICDMDFKVVKESPDEVLYFFFTKAISSSDVQAIRA